MRKVIFLILLPFILVLGYALVIDALKYGGTSVILDITELIYYIIFMITIPLSFFAADSIRARLKKKVSNKYLRCVVDIAFFIAAIYAMSSFVACEKKSTRISESYTTRLNITTNFAKSVLNFAFGLENHG